MEYEHEAGTKDSLRCICNAVGCSNGRWKIADDIVILCVAHAT